MLTSILAACVLVHGHDEYDTQFLGDSIQPHGDWPFESNPDEPMLGHRAPHTGGLGEPCGDYCDNDLYCKYEWHGSYSTATCQREKQHAGGENQRCRTVQEGSPCDSGLRCERVKLLPSGSTQLCRRAEPDNQPGEEGQRCRTVQEGSPCNSGLHCNRVNLLPSGHKDICQRQCIGCSPSAGEEGQRCRTVQEGSPCNSGLRCQRVRLLPSGFRDVCQAVHPHNEGEMNMRCNDPPLAPCNHNNLRPHYERKLPSGHSCICRLNLASSSNADSGEADSDPKLGMPAPEMGGRNQPCRNGNAWPWTKCDAGLYCHQWTEGQATMGTCKPNNPSPPLPPHQGREGEPCRNPQYVWQGECDAGLFCAHYSDGSATYGICTRNGPSPSPSPSPSNCGALHQKCCSGKWCQGSLVAVESWEHQFGQAFEVPVWRCESSLGAGNDEDNLGSGGDPFNDDDELSTDNLLGSSVKLGSGDDSYGRYRPGESPTSDPKLGMPAPEMGGRNQPCRNTNVWPWRACDEGLHCDYWTEGQAVMGVCKPNSPSPTPTPPSPPGSCGYQGERCCNGQCYGNTEPLWEHQRGQAFSVCRCQAVLYSHGPAPKGGN